MSKTLTPSNGATFGAVDEPPDEETEARHLLAVTGTRDTLDLEISKVNPTDCVPMNVLWRSANEALLGAIFKKPPAGAGCKE